MTAATPLAMMKGGEFAEVTAQYSLSDMFIGNIGGSLGEISVLMLLIGGLLIRYGGLYGVEGWLPRQIPFATDLACLAVLFAAAAVAVYRKIVTRIIGGVIRNDLFFEKLRFTIRIFSSFIYILLTPLFLVVALTEGPGIDRLLHGTAVFAAALYLLYLAKSYRFFVARDVSILQWILYLCAVELFPISFFVLVVARNC